MKISIIVPVYNVEKYLKRCVYSLLCQDLPSSEYEIILVNDGSTDNSVSIAKSFANKYDNIRLISQENQGLSGARNTGLAYASGEYIFFVDSDDFVKPNIIGKVYNKCIENNLDICFYGYEHLDSDLNVIKLSKPLCKTDRVYTGFELLHNTNDIGSVWKCFYSRKLIKEYKLSFYPKITHQDSDFNYAAYAVAKRVMGINLIGYSYYWNDKSLSHERVVPKIAHNIKSDIVVAKRLKNISNRIPTSKRIIKDYLQRSNSLVFSIIIQLYREKLLSKETKKEIFSLMIEQGLFPIKGRTASVKTTLLVPFVNAYFNIIWK